MMRQFPLAPSNRTLAKKMVDWGWDFKKQMGDLERYHFPFTGDSVEIVARDHRQPTLDEVIKRIVVITAGGDYNKFWAGPPAPAAPVEEPKIVFEQRKKVHLNRGNAAKVLAVLVASGKPMNAKQIHAVDESIPTHSVANSFAYLQKIGNVVRVMNGVYRVADKNRSGEAMHHTGGPIEHSAPILTVVAEPSVSLPVVHEKPVERQEKPVLPVVTPAKVEDSDEMMNTLLDIMFPNGFKGRHLPAIEEWKAQTHRLVKEISS